MHINISTSFAFLFGTCSEQCAKKMRVLRALAKRSRNLRHPPEEALQTIYRLGVGLFENIWARLNDWGFSSFWRAVEKATSETDGEAQDAARRSAASTAPIIWLLGKTGSGKTSIVAALTRDPRAAIGRGFKPCTAHSFIYEWPREAPVLRFLDTRGLGEPGYDPGKDIAYAERQAHFLLVTMKVADPLQDEVLSALKEIRLRHPSWPALVAQTSLHALYPRGAVHPPEYPYAGTDADDANTVVPEDLRRASDISVVFSRG